MSRPKALIAWSSGKDSAWALHEVRRAGEYEMVGALTTVTEAFARVSMHGVREDILRAQHQAIGKTHATRWSSEPWALGAFSAAAVNGQGGRKVLMEPVRERLFFAGEAIHETLWGTVGGAWESGERAADAALRLWGRR